MRSNSPTISGPVIVVAASNSTARAKRMAQYKCDGTADQTEILAAILAANTAGGGTVFLAAGTYYLATGIYPGVNIANIRITGDGPGTKIHGPEDGSQLAADPDNLYYLLTFGKENATLTAVNCQVDNIQFVGMGANLATGYGAIHGCPLSKRIRVTQCLFTHLGCAAGGVVDYSQTYESVVEDCTFIGCQIAVYLTGTTDQIRNRVIDNVMLWCSKNILMDAAKECIIKGNQIHAQASGTSNSQPSNNHITTATSFFLPEMLGMSVNFSSSSTTYYQILSVDSPTQVTVSTITGEAWMNGDGIHVTGRYGSVVPVGISISHAAGPSRRLIIKDNHIFGPFYGIRIVNCQGADISGNYISSHNAAAEGISVDGTASKNCHVHGNVIEQTRANLDRSVREISAGQGNRFENNIYKSAVAAAYNGSTEANNTAWV